MSFLPTNSRPDDAKKEIHRILEVRALENGVSQQPIKGIAVVNAWL